VEHCLKEAFMENDIANLKDYIFVYKQFRNQEKQIVEATDKIISLTEDTVAKTISKNESSVFFKFCGFDIKLVCEVNAMKDVGLILWYHVYFDEIKQLKQGRLLITHYFDHLGNIYQDKDRKSSIYSPRVDFDKYLENTILQIIRSINEWRANG
jgi:hypothetical protein